MDSLSTSSPNNTDEISYESDYLSPVASNNIATAMVINPNINYHYVNANAASGNFFTSETSSDSLSTGSDTGTLASFNYSVNNIAQNLNNLTLGDKSFNFVGSNLVGTSNIGYSATLVSSAQYNAGLENKCLRCGNQVYALERIGPIKSNVYHKTCFKCLTCDRQLDLKTYYTNQIDLNDRQIYCQSHAPKSGKGSFGADNIHIHNVLNAPKLDVMQRVNNKHKVFFAKLYLGKKYFI